MTPVMRDRSKSLVLDVSDMYEDFLREQREFRFPLMRLEGAILDKARAQPPSSYKEVLN